MRRPTSHEIAHYHRLDGCTITGTGWADFEGQPMPVLILRTPDGKKLHAAVQCDPEGNGPGHLEIETP